MPVRFTARPPRLRAELAVIASSLVTIGSFFWLPTLLYLLWRRARRLAAAARQRRREEQRHDRSPDAALDVASFGWDECKAWAPFLAALAGVIWLRFMPLRSSKWARKHPLWDYWHEYFFDADSEAVLSPVARPGHLRRDAAWHLAIWANHGNGGMDGRCVQRSPFCRS